MHRIFFSDIVLPLNMFFMKQFLLKMRNAGAVVCACIVAFLVMSNFYFFGKDVFTHVSRAEMFATLQMVWWLNLTTALVSGLGNLLYKAEDGRRADVLAFSGICGMCSFAVIGFFYIWVGFTAGEVWRPIMMFFVTAYACAFIFFGTSYFVRLLRNIMPRRDEDFEECMTV